MRCPLREPVAALTASWALRVLRRQDAVLRAPRPVRHKQL